MQSTFQEVHQRLQAAIMDVEWVTTPIVATLIPFMAITALFILASMTLPTGPRRPRRLRARLHITLASSISTLAALATLGLASIAVAGLARLVADGLPSAWQAYQSHGSGQAELLMLLACVVLALLSRWHREVIAGTTHFTLSHVLRCQALRSVFLATPLLLIGLVLTS